MRGFVRVSAAVPLVKAVDFEFNRGQILSLWEKAYQQKSILVCFPELSISAYTVKDLFSNTFLLKEVIASLGWLLERGKDFKTIAIVGMPLVYENNLYNCAVAIQGNQILCAVPKSYLPDYGEFEEKRWFKPGRFIPPGKTIEILGQTIPFGTDILLSASNLANCKIGIEVCEDISVQASPNIYQVSSGATIISNLSASNFTIGKTEFQESLVKNASGKGKCCYIYTSSASGESSELAWDGHHFICENGTIIAKGSSFSREPQLLTCDVDIESLIHDRMTINTFGDCANEIRKEFRIVSFTAVPQDNEKVLLREINRYPFIPSESSSLVQRCREIFEIQTNSLRTRLERAGCQNIILGVSGGLDSTLAALAASNTLGSMSLSEKNLICVTMPGLGTSKITKDNAIELSKHLGATFINTSISDISYVLLRTIEHASASETTDIEDLIDKLRQNPQFADTTLENVQARIRTLLLMSYANKYNGLVLGTGDLSEKALGWSTYAGDQISMYDINSGIPKTMIQFIIKWAANEKVQEWHVKNPKKLREILFSILNTPISPELLPPDFEDHITQLTEENIGPYELNDFFLYWHVRHGASPQKILDIAQEAFKEIYDLNTLKKWLINFYRRFSTQQFKRLATADGPKIGMVDLSPRGSWRMSADTDYKIWVKEVEKYS